MARLLGGAAPFTGPALLASWGRASRTLHRRPLGRAVDQGACADTTHVWLTPATPPGSRELFRASNARRAQVIAMLRVAVDYTCRSAAALTVWEHPLNAPGDLTCVRAVIGRDHLLLETIPS